MSVILHVVDRACSGLLILSGNLFSQDAKINECLQIKLGF